jgi:hypothetical protein
MSDTSQIRPSWELDDATIEAIVEGGPVASEHEPVVAFARQVRAAAVGDLPRPAPSPELARILRGDDGVTIDRRKPVHVQAAGVASKVAGLGVAAKVVLGATVAAASVAGAGAAGVLPGKSNDAVRDAIEAVTPVHFDEGHGKSGDDHGKSGDDQGKSSSTSTDGDSPATDKDHPDNFGATVSSDAHGESDGQKGVDGQQIRDENPGSEHRSDHAADGGSDGSNGKSTSTPNSTVPVHPTHPTHPTPKG